MRNLYTDFIDYTQVPLTQYPIAHMVAEMLRQNLPHSNIILAIADAEMEGKRLPYTAEMKAEIKARMIAKKLERHEKSILKISRRAKATKKYRKGLGTLGQELLRQAIDRDGPVCVYCAATKDLTIDHVVPISRGGTNHKDNIKVCCLPCNNSKNNRLLCEWKPGVTGKIGRIRPDNIDFNEKYPSVSF